MKELDVNKGIIYRTKDLNDEGISNYIIAKMAESGELVKICHGVYALDDVSNIKLTDINVIVENGVISLMSAALCYELIDGSFGKTTITIDRDQKPPRIPYDMFVYIYTTSSLYDIGLNVYDVNGRSVKIYDIERTICDILKHRSKYDSQLVKQIVINYLERDDCDIEKLLDYAKQLRIYNVVKRCLEIIGDING